MKRTNILAITVLLLMSLFISSCERDTLNEQTQQLTTGKTSPINAEAFFERTQQSIATLNEVYANADGTLDSRDFTDAFEQKWGTPNYDKFTVVKTLEGEHVSLVPLEDVETGYTHNLLVGWQTENAEAQLRMIHDNRSMTDITFDNTPITPSFNTLSGQYNLESGSIDPTTLPEGCYTVYDCPDCGCIICLQECGTGGSGSGSDPTSTGGIGGGGTNPPTNTNTDTDNNNTGGGNSDSNTPNPNIPDTSNETTNPDCFDGCADCFDLPDDPACAGACAGTFDLNCDGTIDNYEICLQNNNIWNCCLINNSCTTEHTVLQTLQNNGINQNDLQWLFDNPSYLSSVMTFAQEKNFDAESMAAIEVLAQLGQNNLLFSDYSQSDIELADQIHINAEACCPFLDPTLPMILDPTLPLQHHIRHEQEYAVLKQKWMDENSGQSPNLYYKTTLFLRAKWNIMIGVTHTALDICGLVPFLGEPCDLVNGVLYTIEGDGMNAALSYASVIPIIGNVAAGTKFYRAYDLGNKTFNLTLEVGQSLYKFGDRNKLKNLIKPGANEQAHHMITWARNDHDIIQLAAQKGWHPSHPKNGINLDLSIHNGWDAAHSQYSGAMLTHLDNQIGQITTPQAAKDFLENLQTSIRTQFENGSKLNEIIF